jgi:hypothetical protein
MNAEELATKYIAAMEKTVQTMQQTKGSITISEECTDEIVGYVKAYLQDAKYFKEQKKFETSLTSIAYCEGLLDALKLIGAVKVQSAP